jgi:CRP-like cAMP-binding protein/sugar phosphate permease
MTGTVSARRPSPYAVFRHRNFSLLWTAQLVSTAGSALTELAAGILVFRITGSALSVGLMLMATAAPTLLIGLFAGVYVDRADRRRIMVAADLIRAAVVLAIPFALSFGIVWLYVLVAVASAVSTFYDPASDAVLPEVAPEEELAAANSMMSISSFGSTAVGFAASGFIASTLPIEWAFWLDGLTFLVSALLVARVVVPKLPVEGEATVANVLDNLRAGARHLVEIPALRSLFLVSAPVLFGFGLWNVLLLPFAIEELHATEFEYGLQEAFTSIGFVAGSLILASFIDRVREGQWLAMSFLGMGVFGTLYGLSNSVPVAILLVTVSGFLNAPSMVARRLIIQRYTPREMRGRVASAFSVARNVLFIMGMAAAGLADIIDIRLLIVIASAVLIVSGVACLLLPGLRQPTTEWRRTLSLLRAAPTGPGLGPARPATMGDIDALGAVLPAVASLSMRARSELANHATVFEAPVGATIVRHGELGASAYFILSGRTGAGIPLADGGYRSMSSMGEGDFFGEISALTGSARTADVVAEEPATLLEVPEPALRALMAEPQISQLVLAAMTERLVRTSSADLPRLAGVDQQDLRELRGPVDITPVAPEPAAPEATG